MSNDPKKRVAIAAQRPENQCCADCGCKLLTSSIWASSTLGIFICINCSGRHRNLGTHITFVRSVGLDSWTDEQATVMESIGNKISNEYWEANLPKDYPRPATEDLDGLTKFIRLKYELGKWADKTRKPPNVLLQEGKKPGAKKSKAAKMAQSKSSTPVATPAQQPVQRSNSTNLLDFGAPAPTMQQSNSVDLLFGGSSPVAQAPVAQQPVSNSASFGLSYTSNAQKSQPTPAFDPFASQQAAQQKPAFGFNQPAARPAAQPAFGFNQPAAQPAFGFGQPAAQPAQQFGFGQPATKGFDPFAQQMPQQHAADPRSELKSMLASSSNHPAPATTTGVFRQNSPARSAFSGPSQPIRGGAAHGPKPKNDAFSGISPF